VLNFPEGTTSAGDRVLPFWRGSFGIAQRLGVPVIPVTVRYRDPQTAWFGGASFVPHYIRMASRPRIDVTVTFGASVSPAPETAEDMAARAATYHPNSRRNEVTDAGLRSQLSPSQSNPFFQLPASPDTANADIALLGVRWWDHLSIRRLAPYTSDACRR
jgi:1-acyl-sn-glycerol-3-phosphate acyltransferase